MILGALKLVWIYWHSIKFFTNVLFPEYLLQIVLSHLQCYKFTRKCKECLKMTIFSHFHKYFLGERELWNYLQHCKTKFSTDTLLHACLLQCKISDGDISTEVQRIPLKKQKFSYIFGGGIETFCKNIENTSNFTQTSYSMHVFYKAKFEIVILFYPPSKKCTRTCKDLSKCKFLSIFLLFRGFETVWKILKNPQIFRCSTPCILSPEKKLMWYYFIFSPTILQENE